MSAGEILSAAAVGHPRLGDASGTAEPVYELDPLADPRWCAFAQRHERSSVFHSPAWLNALRKTYRYRPVAFTTEPPGCDLRSAIVFCHVRSWLTGRRLVSLPFSDHCEPLVASADDLTK